MGCASRTQGKPATDSFKSLCIALASATVLVCGAVGAQPSEQDLSRLSLEDLGKIVVTSVAKSPEPLADAPAAVYVITHDLIMRSGATSLPEILRLAPNLEVFQTSPSNYVITARGFSGNSAAQNYSDKLLVLIDGRSVYSPIFSGMYWDSQYVPPEDIERIEVISGPGGALWGANAVNGVINIITRKSSDTQGGLLEIGTGNALSNFLLQYGGRIGDDAYYRFYARDFHQPSFDDSTGADAHDGWSNPQVGFRVDWQRGADAITLQGDGHSGNLGQPDASDLRIAEGDVQASWQRQLQDGASFQLRTYYDNVRRWNDISGGGFSLDTFDLEAQHDFALGDSHHITWGIGDRTYRYDITPRIGVANSLLWDPASSTQNLANAFVQDQVSLGQRIGLTLGLKAEHDPYSGLSWMPSMRLAWKASDTALLWAAASRAVRTPTAFDEDVIEELGSEVFLTGNPDFRREQLTALEAGFRNHWSDRARLSVSFYYNTYDDLKSIEFSPTVLPLLWGNGMEGHTYGMEAWGSYAIADWWRLSAGVALQRQHLRFAPESSGLLGVSQAGDDPEHQGFIRSTMNLSDRWTLYADLREVGALPDPHVPAYVELNTKLGWQVNDKVEISLSGLNLLHPWHQEFVFPGSDRIGRSVFLDTRVRY